ncbi:MAG: gliding motility-associated C-terminal domain-containing protein, partial [Bacteroidetes bacterium]|nr:gliding motility-associated C-terminal domain-containing protein [Bacteroidota bacterium]
ITVANTGDVTDEADNCSTGIEATFVDSDPVAGSCEGTYVITRTWSLADNCGNSAEDQTQTITISDNIVPTFTAPESLTINCEDDALDLNITGDVNDEADNCSTSLVATFSDSIEEGDCPNERIITRTWSLVDDCGNNAEDQIQTITIIDDTPPELITNLPTAVSATCDDIPTAPSPGFADNCSTNLSIVFNESTTIIGSMVDDYEIVRTWTVTDECDNTSVFTQIVTVAILETVTQIADAICFDDGSVDLNDYLSDIDEDVSWEVVSGGATLDGSILDPSNLELADYVFSYTFAEVGGCLSTTELTITVDDSCIVLACEVEDVIISKAVTPNGDQWNEFFSITGVEGCGFIFDVQIFNRWGAKIYESSNYQNDWSGTAHSNSIGNADKVPSGTYYYIVKLRNSSEGLELKPLTGPIYVGTK